MPRINIPEEYEPIIDALMEADDALKGLESTRHLSLVKTNIQQAMLWLLCEPLAEALEADVIDFNNEATLDTGKAIDAAVNEGMTDGQS
jgi:hypothetical protein